MKKISLNLFVLFFTLVLLWSCGSPSTTTSVRDEIQEEIIEEEGLPEDNSPLDSVKYRRVSEQIHGHWMAKETLEAVEKTGSLYKNRELKTKYYGFILDKGNLMNTDPYLNGFTRTVGGITVKLKYNRQKNHYESRPNAIENIIVKPVDEKNIELFFVNSNKTEHYQLTKEHFEQNRLLLTVGKYKDKRTGKAVEFKENGQVSGLGKLTYHEVAIDFTEGPFFDALYLDSSGKLRDKVVYHFKKEGKDMKLFEVRGKGQKQTYGDLLYDLEKL